MGTTATVAADCTPGTARMRSISSRWALGRRSAGILSAVRFSSVTRSPSARKPGLTPATLCSVRAKSSEPKRSASDSAICTTTSPRRRASGSRPAVAPRVLARITLPAATRVPRMAGARPNSRHVASARRDAKATTLQSRPSGSVIGLSAVSSAATSHRPSVPARSTAHTAPIADEQQALGEELPDNPHARGAEPEAHADLFLARARARQQQVREVRARDHEHQSGNPEQQQERRFVRFTQLRETRPAGMRGELELQVLRHADRRIRCGNRGPEDRRRHRGELRVGAIDGPAWLQPAEDAEPPCRSRIHPSLPIVAERRFGAERERDVERAADLETVKARGRDADDFGRTRVERDGASDDRGIAAVGPAPEAVPEDRARRAASAIVLRRQQPAGRGAHAERVEELAADPEALGETRLAAVGEVEGLPAPDEEAVEGVLPRLELAPDRLRHGRVPGLEIAARAVHVGQPDFEQARRIGDRQGAKTHGVHDLEERRVRADPEREREDRDQREAGIAAEETQRVAHVLRGVLEPASAPDVARRFLDLREVAQLAARGGGGVPRILPARDAVGRGHPQVRLELFPELGVPVLHGVSLPAVSRGCRSWPPRGFPSASARWRAGGVRPP